jgi:exodeoxyribonuclease V alpha subunit
VETVPLLAADDIDETQVKVVASLAGSQDLVVIEGAAGAGKTTTLAATRAALDRQDQRMVVVTPTLKAAAVAARQVGSRASPLRGLRINTVGGGTKTPAGPPSTASREPRPP